MNRKLSFTLIELLVVIAIVGILSGLIIVGMNSSVQSATIAKAQIFSNSLRNSLLMNLVSEWKLDQVGIPAANQTPDSWNGVNACTLSDSGGACDATHCPQLQTTGCVYGNCFSFNASGSSQTQYLNCGSNPSINSISSAITVEAWVYPRASQSYGYIVSNDRDCCGTYNGYSLWISSGTPFFTIWNSSQTRAISSVIQKINNWNYLVGTFDGSNVKIYVNGQQTGTSSYVGTIGIPASYNLIIGGMGFSPTLNINATIDNIRIYNSSIPASQIKENYYAGIEHLLSEKEITKEEYWERIGELINNLAKN